MSKKRPSEKGCGICTACLHPQTSAKCLELRKSQPGFLEHVERHKAQKRHYYSLPQRTRLFDAALTAPPPPAAEESRPSDRDLEGSRAGTELDEPLTALHPQPSTSEGGEAGKASVRAEFMEVPSGAFPFRLPNQDWTTTARGKANCKMCGGDGHQAVGRHQGLRCPLFRLTLPGRIPLSSLQTDHFPQAAAVKAGRCGDASTCSACAEPACAQSGLKYKSEWCGRCRAGQGSDACIRRSQCPFAPSTSSPSCPDPSDSKHDEDTEAPRDGSIDNEGYLWEGSDYEDDEGNASLRTWAERLPPEYKSVLLAIQNLAREHVRSLGNNGMKYYGFLSAEDLRGLYVILDEYLFAKGWSGSS